eukprot:TRINITY_DN6359_c0_g1_i3.p1 TRINITY_DN6359_c0_g1~~TRINITY_DN6359_c0_g1_i3.p1  ORF type:complete len:1426 (+),score=279.61 TRINITY_DN6359_c0_g1_i3:447-4724(+)
MGKPDQAPPLAGSSVPAPTASPTASPSVRPTAFPTAAPTRSPTTLPTASPSAPPTDRPTEAPSAGPLRSPTTSPAMSPSIAPSQSPSVAPSAAPTAAPYVAPSTSPSLAPTAAPTRPPTANPTNGPLPFNAPTRSPQPHPTRSPSTPPTSQPSGPPTTPPTIQPSLAPSRAPTRRPTTTPSQAPSRMPTTAPIRTPSVPPSLAPTSQPSATPTTGPAAGPTIGPTELPSRAPTATPARPTRSPSSHPSVLPSASPSEAPSAAPSRPPLSQPTAAPSGAPSAAPTASPSAAPTVPPSTAPTVSTVPPSTAPTVPPSTGPTVSPSAVPSRRPSTAPSAAPTQEPTLLPSKQPSALPSTPPTASPSTSVPTAAPSVTPSLSPTDAPSRQPSGLPSRSPSVRPSVQPSTRPTSRPSSPPSAAPTTAPSPQPTQSPSSLHPSAMPSKMPSVAPSTKPPTVGPTRTPSLLPSATPTASPRRSPTARPTAAPSIPPSPPDTTEPSRAPSPSPTAPPSTSPIGPPSTSPTAGPTNGTCPEGHIGFPDCRQCSVAADCNNHAVSVWANQANNTCVCNCLLRKHRTSDAPERGDEPLYAGATCDRCGPTFTSYPHCTGCSAANNCTGQGAVDAELVENGCKCVCNTAYTGADCNDCAAGYERGPKGCTGARELSVSPASVEGQKVNEQGVDVVVTAKGDQFSVLAVRSFGTDSSTKMWLQSNQKATTTGMEHAFDASYTTQMANGTQNETLVLLRPYLGCPFGYIGACVTSQSVRLRLGPLSTYGADLRETITVRFGPEAFTSYTAGWPWEGAQVQFDIKVHKRTFAGAETVQAALGSGGAVALTAGAPTGAGKLALVAELANCPSQEVKGGEGVEELGFTGNPLSLGIGAGHTALNFGASVANTLVLLPTVCLLHLGLCGLVYKARRACNKKTSFYGCMALLLFPGGQIFPILLFYQGTLEATLRVLYYGAVGQRLAVFPVLMLLAVALPWGIHRVTTEPHLKAVVVPYERSNTLLRRLLFGAMTWESPVDRTWVERWGMMFWDYTFQRRQFLNFEICSIVGLSVLGAWSPAGLTECLIKVGGIGLVFLVCLLVAVCRNPFLARYDWTMYVTMTGCEFVGVLCAFSMTAKGMKADTKFEEAVAGVAMMMAMICLFLKTILDMAFFFFEKWEDVKARKSAKQLPLLFSPSGQGSDLEVGATSLALCDESMLLEGNTPDAMLRTISPTATISPAASLTQTPQGDTPGVRPCPAPGCQRTFMTPGAVDRHVKTVHLCRSCGSLIASRRERDEHQAGCAAQSNRSRPRKQLSLSATARHARRFSDHSEGQTSEASTPLGRSSTSRLYDNPATPQISSPHHRRRKRLPSPGLSPLVSSRRGTPGEHDLRDVRSPTTPRRKGSAGRVRGRGVQQPGRRGRSDTGDLLAKSAVSPGEAGWM